MDQVDARKDVSGHAFLANSPFVRAIKTTTTGYATTGGLQVINYDSAEYMDGITWSAGNPSRITIVQAGYYKFTCHMHIVWTTVLANSGVCNLVNTRNGAAFNADRQHQVFEYAVLKNANQLPSLDLSGSGWCDMAAGDYMETFFSASSAQSLNITAAEFSCFLINYI